MKVRVFCVGRLKEEFYREACAEYVKRLNRVEVIELRDSTPEGEAEEILKRLKDDFLVVLDETGEEKTSEGFAQFIGGRSGGITFVIGGPDGTSDKLKKRANLMMSMSKMTFPHELARLVLLEQVYRAQMINQNRKYHR
ncbi:MAG: hypothetical protein MSIBF_06295 [Candidatus Altiarchaeales archaeon IMC4]|nr:MAG: hypothetical protein MSIBF_06295 [Candidatus Altiarchaeales archaeon IMC4]